MSVESERERSGHWNVVRGRLEIVAAALELPASEVEKALKDGGQRSGPLLDFARRYHQDLNWLLGGDVGSMCRQLAWDAGWRPKWWAPEYEKTREAAEPARREAAEPGRLKLPPATALPEANYSRE